MSALYSHSYKKYQKSGRLPLSRLRGEWKVRFQGSWETERLFTKKEQGERIAVIINDIITKHRSLPAATKSLSVEHSPHYQCIERA